MGSARKLHKGKAPPQLRSRQTRSSKGRLLTGTADPAATTAQLTSQLRALGLYAADTLGDGNCLFRALSDQLYGTPSRHAELRQRICDWIARHRERYAPFVEDERGLETHLSCMREHGTYGGHLELSACAHMERRDVKVVQPGLVYVIEWRAFASSGTKACGYGYEDGEESGDASEEEDDEEDKTLTLRRTRRAKDKHTRPPDHDSTDTIYVAYHDWEHFSSIRNLRGPHTGLPCVRETPVPVPAPTVPPPTKLKKKKVTLKLSNSRSATPDPTSVPLPSSRAVSPPPSSVSTTTTPAPHPLRASHIPATPSPPPPTMHLDTTANSHLHPPPHHTHQHHTRTHASPKRALDTTADDSECSSSGSVKRSRRGSTSLPRVSCAPDPDPDPYDGECEAEAETSTPALSPASSRTSTSTSTSSMGTGMDINTDSALTTPPSSSASSPDPESSPEPEDTPVPAPAPAKPLTRRQRKALGLPKPRAVGVGVGVGAGAGKIVIPGGRFKRRAGGAREEGEGEGEEGEEEWVRNGTGRVDVRGFRELRI